jgi:hypothetical protein
MPDRKDNQEVRKWLRDNGYHEVADLIDQCIARWKAEGKKTRRNWWEILAGDKEGNSRMVDGIAFPVLKTARARQGLPKNNSAISLSKHERRQRPWQSGRWN